MFHCTAGKDRTGFASALIFSLFGIDHETIIDDYLLSNKTSAKVKNAGINITIESMVTILEINLLLVELT